MIFIVYALYLFLQPVIALRTGTAFIRMMSLLLTVVRSAVVSPPSPPPVSRSCWRTQTRRVSGVQPIFGAMEQIVAHCESYSP
ncbi:Hypothetical protein Asd1617_06383 (plasmid) [Shigella dysenteriae 1617]|uniref:Uncharacterized protein n=1 Tax=Shigella dysenteriae 1617 TaxID=754093 RepID=A0A0A7A4V8_SHIDY|nr:Hypothetical protein Asd1617_06383 [Shigella dysenteriae 1617]